MWAITSYYNPKRYASRLRNFRIFQEQFNVPLIAVEFSHDGLFELDESLCDIHIKLKEGDVLWQKEALLNVGIKYVPDSEEDVTFVDADVLFIDQNWAKQVEHALCNSLIVQPFSQVRNLDRTESNNQAQLHKILADHSLSKEIPKDDNGLKGSQYSFAKSLRSGLLENGFFDNLASRKQIAVAPGFALSGKKKFFETHPLFDKAVIGGGDSLFWDALSGEAENMANQRELKGNYRQAYLSWASSLYTAVGDAFDYVEGGLLHLWHGQPKNRRYFIRDTELRSMHFDPSKDLVRSSEDIWKWAPHRSDLKAYLRSYFLHRKEDS